MAARSKKRRKTKPKRFRLIGLTSRALMMVAAGMLLFSCLALLANPVHFWFLTVFGLFYVPLFLLNLVLAVWAVFRKSKAVIIPVIALLPAVFFVNEYWKTGKGNMPEDTEGISMISWNVGRFAQYGTGRAMNRSSCADSVINWLKNCDADIICLQEIYVKDAAQIQRQIGRHFKGYDMAYYVKSSRSGECGNLTLSRFPISDKGKIDFEDSSNLVLYTDIRTGDRTVRVFNCHLQSYAISMSSLLTSLGHDEELIHETGRKMKASIRRRPRQVDQVLRNIHDCPLETIVAGDFNDTPMSHTYFKLKKNHKDSFSEAGKGFGGTFVTFRAMLRIDYILIPKSAEALSHEVPKIRLSDHYPVKTKFSL